MTTWRAADLSAVVDLVRAFAGWPWPLAELDVAARLQALGWTSLEDDPCGLLTNLGVTPGVAMVNSGRTADAQIIDFTVTDVARQDAPIAKAGLTQDVFTEYASRFRQEWGRPIKVVEGDRAEMWWAVEPGSAVQLVRDGGMIVSVEFCTPQGVRVNREAGQL